MGLSHFSHVAYLNGSTIPEYIDFFRFLAIFHALNEYNGIYRYLTRFELQVCYSLSQNYRKIRLTTVGLNVV